MLVLQVTLLLSTYILSHKEKFFDSRNIKLAIVAGDPLGEAFGVQAFHWCQVNNLLKSQLIPLQSNGSTDIKAEVRSTGSSGVNVSISEMSVPVTSKLGEARPPADLTGSAAGLVLPAFPSLNKALTAPAGSSSGIVRKRSDSESEPEARNKQARTEVRNLVIVRPGSRRWIFASYSNTSHSVFYSAIILRTKMRIEEMKTPQLFMIMTLTETRMRSMMKTLMMRAIPTFRSLK